MLEPRYIDAGTTSKTTPGQSLRVLWVCCTMQIVLRSAMT